MFNRSDPDFFFVSDPAIKLDQIFFYFLPDKAHLRAGTISLAAGSTPSTPVRWSTTRVVDPVFEMRLDPVFKKWLHPDSVFK